MLDLNSLVAIDVHTHADGPCGTEAYEDAAPTREAMKAYFKHDYETKTVPEIAQYYRERKIGCVIFTVDSEAESGHAAIPTRRLRGSAPTMTTS
jgi:uncharacterized protein